MGIFSHPIANIRFTTPAVVENVPTVLEVVAAAIRDDRGRLLLQQRPEGKQHAGLWEFPGGKVEQGETHAEALIREIAEELDLVLDPTALGLLGEAREAAVSHERQIVLFLYSAPGWAGVACGMEGQECGWFTPEQAVGLPLPPMDRHLLGLLAFD